MVIHRTHTAANVAPAIRILRDQINAAYPNRLRTSEGHDSDGIWPSAAHTAANPNSDHEAGNALDIDDDLSGYDGRGASVTPEFARLLSRDPRCKYTIHDGYIYKAGSAYIYSGSNKHTTHVHVSVDEEKRDGTAPWKIAELPPNRYLVTTSDVSMWAEPRVGSRHVRVVKKGLKVRQVGPVIAGMMKVRRWVVIVGWVDIRKLRRLP